MSFRNFLRNIMGGSRSISDIPPLTEWLSKNKTFIRTALKLKEITSDYKDYVFGRFKGLNTKELNSKDNQVQQRK
jgi:hypothetical protein